MGSNNNQKKKKTVAIVGFAHTTLQFAQFSEAEEMWTVNFAWRYAVPRIDRLFEIHPIEVLAYNGSQGEADNPDKKHFEWLQEEHDFPIYTWADYTGENILDTIMEDAPRIPNSIPYPFEILDPIFENFNRENRPGQVYMPSTISYMLALAIHEGFERIEMYGVEMAAGVGGANGTEYIYQKAGTEALLMYAMGKGIEVYLPEHCKLMNIKPYHKGLQMITRQTLEAMKKKYEQQRGEAQNKTNYYKGQIEVVEKALLSEMAVLQKAIDAEKIIKEKNALEKQLKQRKEAGAAEAMEVVKKTSQFQGLAYMADTAVQNMEHLINSIDLDDPLCELVNRFAFNEVEPKEEKLKKEKVTA